MMTTTDLATLAEKLFSYDVIQNAWEHERRGFEINARHVLTHLAKDLVGKQFTSSYEAQTAIAPDCMQYALRLCRWAHIAPRLMFDADCNDASLETEHFVAFAKATGVLAENLHDLDHKTTNNGAILQRTDMVKKTASLLMRCAQLQSKQYGFDLIQAFDQRLACLRERYGIPHPALANEAERHSSVHAYAAACT